MMMMITASRLGILLYMMIPLKLKNLQTKAGFSESNRHSFSLILLKMVCLFILFFVFLYSFQDWQPPFACDVDRLKFTPRIQRLNELEVHLSSLYIYKIQFCSSLVFRYCLTCCAFVHCPSKKKNWQHRQNIWFTIMSWWAVKRLQTHFCLLKNVNTSRRECRKIVNQ